MGKCPDSIKRLIDRFDQQSDQIRSPDYNETLIRIDFINPMMSELGWDIDNHQGFAEQYREVVHEDRVKVAGQTKAPDYSFRIGGVRKFFLEAKKPAVDIKNNWEPAYQLRRYAWSAKLACSLLTDFEEFAIYDTRVQPKQLDKAREARRDFLRYSDYCDRWEFLSGVFSKDAVLKGEFDRYCESKKGRGAQLFDEVFLGEIELWRKSIAASLARNNEALDEAGLNFAVQRIIDRIIFLRIAEDRGTETVGQLQALLNGDHVFARLNEVFRRADERYNSGLFHFAREKDRDEAPDTLTPTLDVDDKTLKTIIKDLYYPQSPYEFTVVPADILGSVYERFLGKVITLTAGHNAKIEEKPEVRKAGGVYYTPTYIVDYIVKNTIGKLLEGKTPVGATPASPSSRTRATQASPLRILDPACGSGSFLIGAYQFLLDWYFNEYLAADPATLATGKKPVLRPGLAGGWALTIAERKRILLDHIHGVDLDGQAVEVTKLNLLLKCLEGETSTTLGFEQRLFRERALPDLGRNIMCGNSLIGTDIIGTDAWNEMTEEERRKINPFDYAPMFRQVFKGKEGNVGGFDAVIGNPPWGAAFDKHSSTYVFKNYVNRRGEAESHLFFLERAAVLLNDRGLLGFITPNTWLSVRNSSEIRRLLLEMLHFVELAELSKNVFEDAPDIVPLIVIASKQRGAAAPTIVRTATVLKVSATNFVFRSDEIDQSTWAADPSATINLRATPAVADLLRRCREDSIELGAVADVVYGIKTGDNDKYVSKAPSETHSKKAIKTGELSRYGLRWQGFYLWYGEHLAGYREKSVDIPKVVVQYIRKISMKRRLIAALDATGEYYPLNNYSYFTPKPESGYDIRYLLGVFNSSLLNFVFANTFIDYNIKPAYLVKLPIRKLTAASRLGGTYQGLIGSVDTMLTLHKRLAAEQSPQRREQIQREIDATDRQIDQLVYQLYGLTAGEIAIVERATQ